MNKRFNFGIAIVPLFLILSAPLFGISGCALRQDVDILRDEVKMLEKRVGDIESKISGLDAVIIAGKFEEKITDLRKKQADFSADIEKFSTDIAGIEGRLSSREASVRNEEKINDEILMLKAEVHNLVVKIEALEGGAEKQQEGSEKDENIKIYEDGKELSSEETQTAYGDAYNEYLNGDFSVSLDKFRDFITNFPKDGYVPNAIYWIGECYYSQGKYKEAISEFGKLIKEYPDSAKAPAAYLKIGYSFLKNNDKKSAINAFKVTAEKFPGTKEADNASKMIKENSET